jgi:cellulose synthase (UDP-forming)
MARPATDPDDARRHPWRVAALVFWILTAATYLGFRLTTLNGAAPVYSSIFFAAELFIAISLSLFVFSTWRFPKRASQPPEPGQTVDVFIATYNEPLDLVRKTAAAAREMDYPHETWILDDGNRPACKALAGELGCRYVARQENTHAKAGNLNNALAASKADFVVTLDADHAPHKSLIASTLGYFCDERIAFVQTPQAFDNTGSFLHLNAGPGTDRWNEQTLWFHAIERGRDHWNAVAYCGSPAMFRRKALDDIGGFATGTITEDTHTSIRAHKRGWSAVYHPQILAEGLAPDTPAAFFTQRLRWGRGQMHVWRLEPILRAKSLSWGQRLCYLASATHYFAGLQYVVLALAPAIGLFAGVVPFSADARILFPLFALNMIAGALTFSLFSRGHGRFLAGEHFNAVLTAPYVLALSALIAPARRFIVTPKEAEGRFALWPIAWPLALALLNTLAFANGAARLASGFPVSDSPGTTLALMFWSIWIATFSGSVVAKAWSQHATRHHSSRHPNRLQANRS